MRRLDTPWLPLGLLAVGLALGIAIGRASNELPEATVSTDHSVAGLAPSGVGSEALPPTPEQGAVGRRSSDDSSHEGAVEWSHRDPTELSDALDDLLRQVSSFHAGTNEFLGSAFDLEEESALGEAMSSWLEKSKDGGDLQFVGVECERAPCLFVFVEPAVGFSDRGVDYAEIERRSSLQRELWAVAAHAGSHTAQVVNHSMEFGPERERVTATLVAWLPRSLKDEDQALWSLFELDARRRAEALLSAFAHSGARSVEELAKLL